MRFILLIYGSESEGERSDAAMDGYATFDREVQQTGIYIGGGALHPTLTATTVRVQDGRAHYSDGPAVRTDFALTGYAILDVRDAAEAVAWAAKSPAARSGLVEIRRIVASSQ